MKTLKTISTAFVVALLVSVVSAPAMDTIRVPFDWAAAQAAVAKNYVADTTVVKDYLNPVVTYVIGNSAKDQDNGVRGIKPAWDFLIRTHGKYTAAAIVAAAGIYAGYNYFMAEEPKEAAVDNTVTQKVEPKEEPAVVVEPKEEPVVVEPKPVVKPVSKQKFGARKMAKSPKAKVATRRTAKPVAKTVAKKTAKPAVKNCKNGKCNVRRGK